MDINKDGLICKEIQFNTEEYHQTVELRREILRKPLGIDFTKEQLMSEFRDHHLVVKDGKNQIIACLILTMVDNFTFKMRQVAVANAYQGKGVGKVLVKFSEDFALKKRKAVMILHARKTAVPFYLSLKYEIIGDEFLEVGIPHNKMVKKLIG
jgi:predicted GNAT family N-acyltransferase